MVDYIPMTKKGFNKKKAELDRLDNVEMPIIAQKIADARAEGDLKENAEYHAQREAQAGGHHVDHGELGRRHGQARAAQFAGQGLTHAKAGKQAGDEGQPFTRRPRLCLRLGDADRIQAPILAQAIRDRVGLACHTPKGSEKDQHGDGGQRRHRCTIHSGATNRGGANGELIQTAATVIVGLALLIGGIAAMLSLIHI